MAWTWNREKLVSAALFLFLGIRRRSPYPVADEVAIQRQIDAETSSEEDQA